MTSTFAFKTTEGKNAVYKAYDAFLGNMRIPHEEVNVDTRFGKAFVIAAGKKDAPVLFVGRKDVMFHSLKTAQRYSSLVPNAKVTVLTEAGHALIGLTDDILAFLRH